MTSAGISITDKEIETEIKIVQANVYTLYGRSAHYRGYKLFFCDNRVSLQVIFSSDDFGSGKLITRNVALA